MPGDGCQAGASGAECARDPQHCGAGTPQLSTHAHSSTDRSSLHSLCQKATHLQHTLKCSFTLSPSSPPQRTFDIWSFALTFFWKLWLVNQKWTYGKEGMTPERVSARKSELVRGQQGCSAACTARTAA